jgi:SAM-dependent methyltransferase
MTSVLRELPLSYPVLSEGCWCGSASAVHEPNPADPPYRASSIAPAGPSSRVTSPRRSSESSTARVRLHLKPGQKGTKQLLAQYGDRLICVRYRYDARRKKRFKTVEILVAERDWEPPRPRFAQDQIVGLRVAFAEVAVRDRLKQAGGTWNPQRSVWQLRYDRVVAADIVTCAQSLHDMEPAGALAEIARVLRSSGVFAAYDYDWPPVVHREADEAFFAFARRIGDLRKRHGIKSEIQQWDKAGHLDRILACGHFRYVRELSLHNTEPCSAERWLGFALTLGHVPPVLELGLGDDEVGVTSLREAAARIFGARELPWYVSYCVRVAVK